jgi:hypothetical protein
MRSSNYFNTGNMRCRKTTAKRWNFEKVGLTLLHSIRVQRRSELASCPQNATMALHCLQPCITGLVATSIAADSIPTAKSTADTTTYFRRTPWRVKHISKDIPEPAA